VNRVEGVGFIASDIERGIVGLSAGLATSYKGGDKTADFLAAVQSERRHNNCIT